MNYRELRGMLRGDEGFSSTIYTDTTGHQTIGYGRNLTAGISRTEAEFLLDTDMRIAVEDLNRAFPWWQDMREDAQLALANMCFNLGLSKLLTFRRMLEALENNDYETAADECLDSKWAEQVGNRAKRIAALFRR